MGGSSGGSSSGVTTIRYAGYVEAAHKIFLEDSKTYGDLAIDNNPYDLFEEVPIDVGFFGAGYTMASFPSLYDMYGKFVAGLDIDALWSQEVEATVNGPEVGNLVAAQSKLLSDELDSTVLPRYMTGMRDMNAVLSSSYMIGKAQLEDTRQKTVAKISAELKYKMLDMAQAKWQAHLSWNSSTVTQYADIMKYYFGVKQTVDGYNYTMLGYKQKWPLEILDYERANLGSLQGATKTATEGSAGGASTGSKVVGGAVAGAAMGSYILPGWGTAIGAVVGGIAGAFM